MRRITLLTVLLGFVVLVMPTYVHAQPPEGGPPGQGGQIQALDNKIDQEIADRETADIAEAAARGAADTALQGAVSAEEAARIADVNAEEAARIADVDAEEAARIAADAALQGAVGAEQAARIAADNAEAVARQAGDTNLQNQINTIAPGFADYEWKVFLYTNKIYQPGSTIGSRAFCTEGKSVLGGGVETSPSLGAMLVTRTYPEYNTTLNRNGWTAWLKNPTSAVITGDVTIHAICATVQ